MKVKEYIDLNVILTGCGKLTRIGLNTAFFSWVIDAFGQIEEVLPVAHDMCGVYDTFNSNDQDGCVIKLVDGRVLWIQSDGRYINFGSTKDEEKENNTQHLSESEKKRIDALCERGLDSPAIAADLVVGRHLREFVHLHDEVEVYTKEFSKKK